MKPYSLAGLGLSGSTQQSVRLSLLLLLLRNRKFALGSFCRVVVRLGFSELQLRDTRRIVIVSCLLWE
jgi:hypothetical protein